MAFTKKNHIYWHIIIQSDRIFRALLYRAHRNYKLSNQNQSNNMYSLIKNKIIMLLQFFSFLVYYYFTDQQFLIILKYIFNIFLTTDAPQVGMSNI